MSSFSKVFNMSKLTAVSVNKIADISTSIISIKQELSVPTSAVHPDPTVITGSRVPCLQDFESLLVLGRGGSSIVFLVREKATRRLYALKQAPKWDQCADIEMEQFIMKNIANLPDAPKSLLPLVASWSDSDNFYVLTPWCEGKDLSTVLVNSVRFSGDRVQSYMAQLVLAVEALHTMHVVHRDIKPHNVFLTATGNIVLGDFGFAKRFRTTFMTGDEEPTAVSFNVDPEASSGSFLKPPSDDMACTTEERCGTLHWMSPAQHAGTAYSFDADMWALGLLMYKMLTGRLPFGEHADTHAELHAAYANEQVVFRSEDGIDMEAQDLIRGLLAKDRKARTTIAEAKAHPYFSNVDWCAAAQHAPAPWAPRAAFVPEAPRKNLFSPGVPLEGEDALCGFMFVKPNFFKPPPGPVKAFALKVARIFRCKATTNTSKNKLKTQAPARVQAAPLGKQEAKSLFVVEVLLDSPAQKSEKAVVDTTGSAVGSHSGDNSSKTSRAAPSSLASSLRVSFTRTRSPRPLSSNPIRPVSSRSPSTAPLPDSAAHSTSDSPGSKVGGPAKKDVKKCSFVRIHRILWSRFFDMHTPAGSGREKADSRKSTSAPSKLNRSSRTSSAPSSSGPSLGSALGACVTDWFQRRFRTKVKCGALKGLDLTIC